MQSLLSLHPTFTIDNKCLKSLIPRDPRPAHLTVCTGCLWVAPAPAAGVGAGEAVDGGGRGELGEGEEGAVQAESPAHREPIGGVLAL